MKRNMWNMNHTFKDNNNKEEKDSSNQGMLIGIGIGVVLYVLTDNMAMVLAGLFIGLMIGASGRRRK